MFGKKNKKVVPTEAPKVLKWKPLDYSPKIILAWVKSLEGHTDITKWLLDNGYKELVMVNQAIYLKEEARNWLMHNGYPHLMAFVNAAEGNEKAQKWLKNNKFELLHHLALAIDDEKESWQWININSTKDIFLLAKTIKIIKDKIEERHNDVHNFGRD